MIEAARSFDPVLLARIGRRLAEIIDPDGVQARDEQPIQDKEADAHRGRDLTLTPDSGGAGGTLRARLDAVGYATLSAFLNAVTTPGATPDGGLPGFTAPVAAAGDGRTLGQRRCDGLVEAVRQALDAGTLPSAGGVKPRIVVTIPYSCLKDRTGAGRSADGNPDQPIPDPPVGRRRRDRPGLAVPDRHPAGRGPDPAAIHRPDPHRPRRPRPRLRLAGL